MIVCYAQFPDGKFAAHGYTGEYDSVDELIYAITEYYRERGEEVIFREVNSSY